MLRKEKSIFDDFLFFIGLSHEGKEVKQKNKDIRLGYSYEYLEIPSEEELELNKKDSKKMEEFLET